MREPSSELWPIIARWTQSAEGGTVTWYLAGLDADRRFWGYVHFRTGSRNENRSFAGMLDGPTFRQVASLIEQIAEHADPTAETKPWDGLVGVGTRSSFRPIFGIRNGVADPDHVSAMEAYREFVNLMQPRLAASL